MPVSAASQSIHLPEDIAKNHAVHFLVYSRLAGQIEQLQQHLPDHLHFLKQLKEKGQILFGGPFFTEQGKNSGNGIYVLKVDSPDQARSIAAEDPLHKAGIRTATVEPWLQDLD